MNKVISHKLLNFLQSHMSEPVNLYKITTVSFTLKTSQTLIARTSQF